MNTSTLLKKIADYKKELTFDFHRNAIASWEKSVKGAIVRSEAAKGDGIKELIIQLQKKIESANFVLQNDRDLTVEDRNKIFIRKDEQQWLIDFFVQAEQTVESAEDEVNKLKE